MIVSGNLVAETGGPSKVRTWRRLLRLPYSEADLARRGFTAEREGAKARFETIGRTFIAGFNSALCADAVEPVLMEAARQEPTLEGFFLEGCAMGFCVGDALSFRRALFPQLLEARPEQTYLLHVGAGWAFARVPWSRRRLEAALDPIHRWLAEDGLGFHDGYFHAKAIQGGWRRVRRGYSARAYMQGLGRAAWFAAGGSPERAAEFCRRLGGTGDAWAGLGLALAYAGPCDREEGRRLLSEAGGARSDVAQGIAFACEAWARAGCAPAHAEAAAAATGADLNALVALVREARDRLPRELLAAAAPSYEIWRRTVARALAPSGETRT